MPMGWSIGMLLYSVLVNVGHEKDLIPFFGLFPSS
jgi:hypothetical protein